MNVDTGPQGSFDFEGQAVAAAAGDTIASALTRAGLKDQRITRHGEHRGVFCGIGLCHDCLVEVDGRQGQRACMTSASGVSQRAPSSRGRAKPAPSPERIA
jgi:predicted molibdopterin-dependent oxidoreductase YjgC